jgi:hypothetical protein
MSALFAGGIRGELKPLLLRSIAAARERGVLDGEPDPRGVVAGDPSNLCGRAGEANPADFWLKPGAVVATIERGVVEPCVERGVRAGDSASRCAWADAAIERGVIERDVIERGVVGSVERGVIEFDVAERGVRAGESANLCCL